MPIKSYRADGQIPFDEKTKLNSKKIGKVDEAAKQLIIDTFNTNIEISGSFEFNGERGLVYHLERITNYRYEYDDSIIRVIK